MKRVKDRRLFSLTPTFSLWERARVRVGAWALSAALFGLALPAKASNPSYLSFDVTFQGVGIITNLTATPGPGGNQITLTWTGPAYNGVNPPLSYSIKTSTTGNILNTGAFNAAQNLSVFTSSFTLPAVATMTAQNMTIGGLTTGVQYCFAMRAQDSAVPQAIGAWLVSAAKGYNLNNCAYPLVPRLPMEPLGVSISTFTDKAIFSWQPVTEFSTGTPFAVSTAPTPVELTGYRVFSATAAVNAPWSEIAGLLSTTTLSWTDFGLSLSTPEYYYVVAENLSGDSIPSNIRAFPSGDFWSVAYDSMSTLDIPASSTVSLSNYYIALDSSPLSALDIQGGTFKNLSILALTGGIAPNPAFVLGALGELSLHYTISASSGQVTPSSVGVLPTPQNSSVFWFNGIKWVQFYGKVDINAQTLNIQTPYLGQYQLRTAERTTGFAFNEAGISNREITPNGDGKNDTVEFLFDNPQYSSITGQIFDLQSHLVSGMQSCPDQPASQCLMWDAKSNGRVVPGGIYVYQIKGEGKTYTGTVVVIR